MSYKIIVTLETEVRSSTQERFQLTVSQLPSKRKLKSGWSKSLVLVAVNGDRLCIPWRSIRSVQIFAP